jgi:anti-sigma factor RsiW
MNCPDVQHLLNPYSDGELDLVRQLEIEEHLGRCTGCAEQEKNLRSLRAAVSAPALYHRAPAGLLDRITQAQPVTPAELPVLRMRPRAGLRFLALAASILLVIAAGTLVLGLWSRNRQSPDDRVAEWIVADHVRSLQLDHLTDVPSSNKHTVKPWFQDEAKIGFVPPVPDLSKEDYTLKGGRLDYVENHQVAALVYLRDKHIINVFIWPTKETESRTVQRLTTPEHYNVRHWQVSGMVYWVISDLNNQGLDDFVQLFQEHAAE